MVGVAQRATQLVSDSATTLQEAVDADALQSSLSDAFGKLNQADFDSLIQEATSAIQTFEPELGSLDDQITGVVEGLNLESFAGDIGSAFKDLNIEGLVGDLGNLDLGSLGTELTNAIQSFDVGELFSNLEGTFGNLTSEFFDISANLGSLNFALGPEGLEANFGEAMDVLQRLNRSLPGEFNDVLKQMEQQGVIVSGRSSSGLLAPASARAPARTTSYRGNAPNPSSSSSAPRTPADLTGRQPGRLTGTRVAFANSDPNQVPRQVIIDSLNAMCNELDIEVQITPEGGWTGRDSGTQNHPTGYAADIQVLSGGAILLPSRDVELYRNIASSLQKIANAKGVLPGIGSYSWGLHYDESLWRQSAWPDTKYMSWTWTGGWNLSGVFV